MVDETAAVLCPTCQTEVTPVISDHSGGGNYCPYCGYDLERSREAAGPHSFAYETVENAYQPSGTVPPGARLKMTGRAILIGLVSVPAAYVALIVAIFLARIIYRLASGVNSWIVTLFIFAIVFLANSVPVIVMAVMVGISLDNSALKNKVRKATAGRIPGLIAGLITALVYGGVYLAILGLTSYSPLNGIEGLTNSETVILILQVLGTLAGIFIASFELKSGTQPFCEACEEYMTQNTLPARHVQHEAQMMNALQTGTYAALKTLPIPAAPQKNKSTVSFWNCGCEVGGGFAYLNTQLMRYKYEGTGEQPVMQKDSNGNITGPAETILPRMVFSEKIDHEAVKELLDVLEADTAAQEAQKATREKDKAPVV